MCAFPEEPLVQADLYLLDEDGALTRPTTDARGLFQGVEKEPSQTKTPAGTANVEDAMTFRPSTRAAILAAQKNFPTPATPVTASAAKLRTITRGSLLAALDAATLQDVAGLVLFLVLDSWSFQVLCFFLVVASFLVFSGSLLLLGSS